MPHKLIHVETDTQTRSREGKLSRFNQENRPWRRLKGNFAYYKVLGEDGELCYTLTGMEEVFHCKIDRRLKKEEARSDRSAEWRTDTPQLQQLTLSSVLVWPVPRASLKTLPEPSSGPTLRSVVLLIIQATLRATHGSYLLAASQGSLLMMCPGTAVRRTDAKTCPPPQKKSQNKTAHPPTSTPRFHFTTSNFTRKATAPLFTRLRTCATTTGVNFADSHRFNLTHKHLDEPQTAQLDAKTKAECSSYLWCDVKWLQPEICCGAASRWPKTTKVLGPAAKTYNATSCSVPVK